MFRLSISERLKIFRRRRGWTQARAAIHFHVSYSCYKAWEAGIRQGKSLAITPKPTELYYIFRIRHGWTQGDLAKRMGCSRYWLGQMEDNQVNHARLANYWERMGFQYNNY